MRIACKSMGTMYLSVDYSINSGASWTTLVASFGGTKVAATTITRSLAADFPVASMWIRFNSTNVHSRGRVQVWDVYVVGSYTDANSFAISPEEGVGFEDSAFRSVGINRLAVN
jgi:hypothetical protein